ncbi:MAG: glycosyltransferase family 39 protein [Candidatus Kapabacteria bacterium]|nr:glycosyltransferase family 39 protein [Ignavibacteriota bacterium]MCW5885295.1 glycosyltransferase family 39 protein [Candidatus Kapabacteria bacterium]
MRNSKKNTKSIIKEEPFLFKYGYIILGAFTLLLYLQTINFGFTGFDDSSIIPPNREMLSSVSNIGKIFLDDAFFRNGEQSFYRPLQNITLMIDTIIAGDALWMYHFTNLVLHIISVIIFYFLLIEIGVSKKTSLGMGTVFSALPALAHAVAWIPGRGDILLAIFSMLFIIYLSKFLNSNQTKYLIYNSLFLALALLSKESGLFLSIIALLFVAIFHKENLNFKSAIIPASIYSSMSVLYLILRNLVIGDMSSKTKFGIEYLISNLAYIPETIGKLFIPISLNPMPSYELINIVTGFILITMIIYFGISKTESRKYLLFGFLWFLLFSIPGMMYEHEFGTYAYQYLEHRAYLPAVGILIILPFIFRGYNLRENTIFAGILLVSIVFFILTLLNSQYYKNELVFYERAIEKSPETAALAYLNRGLIKARSGNPKAGIEDFNTAASIFPEYPDAYNNRGLAKTQLKDKRGVMEDYNKAISLDSNRAVFFYNRAIFKSSENDIYGALDDYKKAIAITPTYKQAYKNINYEYTRLREFDSCIHYTSLAILQINDNRDFYYTRGLSKLSNGDTADACEDFQISYGQGLASAGEQIRKHCK